MKFSRGLTAYKYLPGLTIRHLSSSSSSSSSSGNYYDVLGLQKDCTRKDIRAAFLAKSKEYHPDSRKRDDLSGEQLKTKFQEVNEAYQVLNDPTERRVYDESLQYPRAGYSSGPWRRQGYENYSDYQQYRAQQEFMRQQQHYWAQYQRQQQRYRQDGSGQSQWETFLRWKIGQPLTIMHFLLALVVVTSFAEVSHSLYIVNYINSRKQERLVYGSDWFAKSPFSEEEADKMLDELEKKSAYVRNNTDSTEKESSM